MIFGAHVIVFTPDADADRAFFRDVLEMDSVDSGGGWLIFAMPPSEIAFHPTDEHADQRALLLVRRLSVRDDAPRGQGRRLLAGR